MSGAVGGAVGSWFVLSQHADMMNRTERKERTKRKERLEDEERKNTCLHLKAMFDQHSCYGLNHASHTCNYISKQLKEQCSND